MKIGTKSILFGAHCWFIHPWFVALAWWKLYGFPRDLRLWVAFFVHDLGYWGKPNMDGPEGEEHVLFGADLMHSLFDRHGDYPQWRELCLYHSRFYAKKHGKPFSKLCVADKLAVTLEPWWFYLPRVIATGEVKEYMGLVESRYRVSTKPQSRRDWFETMTNHMRGWVTEHQDLKRDTWTPEVSA